MKLITIGHQSHNAMFVTTNEEDWDYYSEDRADYVNESVIQQVIDLANDEDRDYVDGVLAS